MIFHLDPRIQHHGGSLPSALYFAKQANIKTIRPPEDKCRILSMAQSIIWCSLSLKFVLMRKRLASVTLFAGLVWKQTINGNPLAALSIKENSESKWHRNNEYLLELHHTSRRSSSNAKPSPRIDRQYLAIKTRDVRTRTLSTAVQRVRWQCQDML